VFVKVTTSVTDVTVSLQQKTQYDCVHYNLQHEDGQSKSQRTIQNFVQRYGDPKVEL